jgi:hypothetical protein
MTIEALRDGFESRIQEIDAYLTLLGALEAQLKNYGPAVTDLAVTSQHQRMLHASVFIQVYNLVEATMTFCLAALSEATSGCTPADLSSELRREWVRSRSGTSRDLTPKERLGQTVALAELIIDGGAVDKWAPVLDKGGNWDDRQIEDVAKRLGIALDVPWEVRQGVRRWVRDERGALALVKDLRNRLAHGQISFDECGASVSVAELSSIHRSTVGYLSAVVDAFVGHIQARNFVVPARRPRSEVQP